MGGVERGKDLAARAEPRIDEAGRAVAAMDYRCNAIQMTTEQTHALDGLNTALDDLVLDDVMGDSF
jgi:hypothetical protein